MNNDKAQSRRKRSPSYPYINLRQALSLIQILYEQEGLDQTPASVALDHMNYKATSGSGVRVLSTLLQFGLLEEEGTRDDKQVYLSDLSVSVLEAPDEETRLEAIQVAALRPPIHGEIYQQWNLENQKLPSVAKMRFDLIRNFGFHKNAVDSFIDEFKETYFFAKLEERVGKTQEETLHDELAHASGANEERRGERSSLQDDHIAPGMKEHTIQLIGQPMARLILPHPLSQKNLSHLINWLNLMGPALTVPEDEYYSQADDTDDDELPF